MEVEGGILSGSRVVEPGEISIFLGIYIHSLCIMKFKMKKQGFLEHLESYDEEPLPYFSGSSDVFAFKAQKLQPA